MDKSPDAFRTISEVAEALETPAHVLRFWETRFPQIKPVKRAGGRRYYRPADVALLSGIKRLLHEEGLTIRGVQKILREQGTRHVSGLTEDGSPEELALEAVKAGRYDAEAAAAQAAEGGASDDLEEERGVILPFPAAEGTEPAEAKPASEAEPAVEVEPAPEALPAVESEPAFEALPEAAPIDEIPELASEAEAPIAELDAAPLEASAELSDALGGSLPESGTESLAQPVTDSMIEPATGQESVTPPARQPDLFSQPEPLSAAAIVGSLSPAPPEPPKQPQVDSIAAAPQEDETTTLAARLRALPLGGFAAKEEALLEIAARIGALRDRMGGLPPRA